MTAWGGLGLMEEDQMEYLVGALGLAVVGLVGVLLFTRRSAPDLNINEAVKSEFQTLSQSALTQASEQFLRLAEERFTRLSEGGTKDLQGKKELIDQQLVAMKTELGKVSELVQKFEKDREQKFGELTAQLKAIGQQTASLTATTGTLKEALASSRARGAWGERMAEDILRSIGFVEGVNYFKQSQIEGGSSRPDFVFMLPDDLKLNMDVKFPLDNYMRHLEAESETEKAQSQTAFLRDVRGRISEITNREYINPEQGTLDYVLLFIPNESVYSFMHEKDPDLLEFGLRNKVVCCAPLTLFAVLAMVRQAADNFALQKSSEQVVSLFGRFSTEWGKFTDSMELVGKRLDSTQKAYESLRGTRRRALERPLGQIETIRAERGIPVAPTVDDLPALTAREEVDSSDSDDDEDED
jgi:DNA recombination protein RmuC